MNFFELAFIVKPAIIKVSSVLKINYLFYLALITVTENNKKYRFLCAICADKDKAGSSFKTAPDRKFKVKTL